MRGVLRRGPLAATGAVAVLLGGLAALPASAQQGCLATNVTSGGSSSNLQQVLDDAAPSDVVEVEGVCVGTFHVVRSVTLVGVTGTGGSLGTLDGAGAGTVLTVTTPTRAAIGLVDLRVTGGATTEFGGGIRVDGADLSLAGATVVDGSAATKGGGVYSASGAVVVKDQASVTENAATKRGGGVATKGRIRVAGDAAITANTAKNGGGIFSNGKVVLDGAARVADNRARRRGAGVSVSYGALELLGSSTVEGNGSVVTHVGGGVYAHVSDVLVGEFAAVVGNAAERAGGVRVDGDVTLTGNATLSGNVATRGVGGLEANGLVLVRESAVVTDNVAGEDGGGIWVHEGLILRGEASVVGNSADIGGGIYTMGPVEVLGDASITGNTAREGAGIYLHYGDVVVDESATVQGNTATGDGGGLYVGFNSSAVLKGSSLVSTNVAGGSGGGAFVEAENPEVPSPEPGSLTLRDASSVTGNTAALAGGGIWNLGTVTFGTLWTGTVCGNSPDDWPGC